jgi:hypothetical protein
MKEWIQVIDLFYMTILQVLSAVGVTILIDDYIVQEDHEKDNKKSTSRLLVEACLYSGMLWVTIHFVGKLIRMIPFPLDGWYGFNHKKQEEYHFLSIIPPFAIIFCDSIHYKLEEIRHRIKLPVNS